MDITCDCTAALDMNAFPCKGTDYGFPTKIVAMLVAGSITVAGDNPTLAEIQAATTASGVNKAIVIEEITNGQRVESSREEESGADTADGLTDTYSVNMAITGRIKKFDEGVRADIEKLNCHSRLKVWVITSKGYIFGGKTGYKVSNFFPQMISEGFGTKGYYPINMVYRADMTKVDTAGYNAGFLTLVNTVYVT